MTAPTRRYKKVFPLLIVFFIVSYLMISFDRHYGWFSPTCTVCQAKVSLNGCQDGVTLEFYPAVTNFCSVEKPLGATILPSFHFNNRASPEHLLPSAV